MFRLPWSTESPGDKIMEKATLHKSRPLSVAELPHFMNKIKRKRTDSPDPTSAPHAHVVKKWKSTHDETKPVVAANNTAVLAGEVAPAVVKMVDVPKVASVEVVTSSVEGASKDVTSTSQSMAIKDESINTSATTMDSGLTAVQQAIEAQINYEILLKHNELRLIEQELAKCQVSLEQLRRCSLIPFPGAEGLSEDVSLGIGAALQPPPGYTTPQYAAPWGVMDGPYTRHYAKWLISDAKFDSISERALAQQAHGYFGHGEGRTTRGSFADINSASRGRTSRTSTGMLKLAPLGETPAPAPKIDPLLHKRSTDGQWVRLYCAQCGHSTFSNTQGFLNHCRIKHNQVFKSHDQAAIACGVPVDVNEVGNPVSATEPASVPATTPAVSFPTPTIPGIVHPLATKSTPAPQAKAVHRDPSASSCDESRVVTATSLKKSSSTPYLMAQAKNSGFQGDLKGLVDMMRSKVDLDVIEPSDDEFAENSDTATPTSSIPPQHARLPITASLAATANKASLARPSSKKGKPSSHARLPLSLPSMDNTEDDHPMLDSPVDFSPNTVESNPGLVSDHDDDDDDDADDAHSQPDLVMNDHDVVVEDASDMEGAQERLGDCFEKGEGSRES